MKKVSVKPQTLEPVLLVDSHHGIYMMQIFASSLLAGAYNYIGVPEDDVKFIADKANMESDEYFDYVTDLENNITLLDRDGNKFSVMFNEDLWAIPENFDTSDWYI